LCPNEHAKLLGAVRCSVGYGYRINQQYGHVQCNNTVLQTTNNTVIYGVEVRFWPTILTSGLKPTRSGLTHSQYNWLNLCKLCLPYATRLDTPLENIFTTAQWYVQSSPWFQPSALRFPSLTHRPEGFRIVIDFQTKLRTRPKIAWSVALKLGT